MIGRTRARIRRVGDRSYGAMRRAEQDDRSIVKLRRNTLEEDAGIIDHEATAAARCRPRQYSLVGAACNSGCGRHKDGQVGIELPQSGNELANGEPTATASSSPSSRRTPGSDPGLHGRLNTRTTRSTASTTRRRAPPTCRPSSPIPPFWASSVHSTRALPRREIPVSQRGRPRAVQPGQHRH